MLVVCTAFSYLKACNVRSKDSMVFSSCAGSSVL